MSKIISKSKLIATTAICAVMLCAKSYALEPTLDTLKAQSTTLSGNYVLTELGSNTLPEGASKVKIGNTVYYFTPSGDDADLLKALAGTSAGNLIEDANGVFEFNGKKYGFNVSAIPNSVFSYGTGDETNYHFITHEANDEGVLTTTYHTISIKPGEFSTSPNITWSSVDDSKKDEANVIAVNLPNDDVKYFQYTHTYTQPTDYTEINKKAEKVNVTVYGEDVYKYIGSNINNSKGNNYGDVVKKVFKENNITGILSNQSRSSLSSLSIYGGVIFNQGTIGDVTADFIYNYTSVSSNTVQSSTFVYGGAISNYANSSGSTASIGDIIGNFKGNYAKAISSYRDMTGDTGAHGGAIYNFAGSDSKVSIGNITGDFISNYAIASASGSNYLSSNAQGGAIYNKAEKNSTASIGNISGNFIGNYIKSQDSYYKDSFVEGGAIFNGGTISDVTGNFINNYAVLEKGPGYTRGGAIYNEGIINNITGNFINNNISSVAYGRGGAIYNEGTISSITGDFIGNSATSTSSSAYGGAIYNDGTISSITGDFTGNSATGKSALGGAIYNEETIESITGDFTGNSATSTSSSALGGAIYNYWYTIIESITGDFTGNSATSTDGSAYGGAICSDGTIESITGDFTGNSATGNSYAYGGAIYSDGTSITGDFIGNSATATNNKAYGGAIYNPSSISNITGDFIGNSATSTNGSASGGAIYNIYKMSSITGDFIGNSATSTSSSAYGGAIYNYSRGTITSVADASNSADSLQDDILFQGNYVEDKDGKRYEAIYNEGTISLKSNNGGSYTFYDFINSNGTGIINLTGDGTGTFNLYNNILNQEEINFQNKYVLNMISPDDIHQDVFTSKYSYIQAQNININAALQMMLDVDLKNAEMDRFEADNFTVADGGSIDVTKFNIVTDVTGDIGTTTEVDFIVSDNVTGLDKITNVTEAVGEVYTYTVTFNPDTGAFEFVSTGLAPEPVEPSTPAPEEVAPNQAPSLTTNTTVAAVDTVITQIFDRDVMVSADTNYGADTTDYVETADGVNVTNDKSVWVKTFGSDDDVEIDNFNGTIDSEAYGIVGGVDSKVFTYDNGVKAAYGIYGAYVGGKQKYDDNKIKQKSGYLGVSAAFRKNNLFSNFTLNGGYITSKANTAWGKDEFDTKVVSVANKTGVDIKTSNGWTITPAMYVAYTGMDTEDYTNKAGVKMENEFANVITLAPEVKAKSRIGKDLDGYVKVSYKYYIYDTDVKADDVLLEEMSAKPYVEYGFGVEKNWDNNKSSYAELTRRNGGREGWNVNLGLRLNF